MPETLLYRIAPLTRAHAMTAVAVLCEAFRDYPVMRFVIGTTDDYDRRLAALVSFFVAARDLKEDLILAAVSLNDEVDGVATVTLPGQRAEPPSLYDRRQEVWEMLGTEALDRYRAYGDACAPFDIARPHYHLNMIGVRTAVKGQGLSRLLLDELHERSARDVDSCGVSLTTESDDNVGLYTHFGYEVVGRATVANGLKTTVMFRPDGGEGGTGAPPSGVTH